MQFTKGAALTAAVCVLAYIALANHDGGLEQAPAHSVVDKQELITQLRNQAEEYKRQIAETARQAAAAEAEQRRLRQELSEAQAAQAEQARQLPVKISELEAQIAEQQTA